MKNPIRERPWLLIVGGLALFVTMWIFFLVIAHRNQPESVPVKTRAAVVP